MPSTRVLLTGANGFLGTHILRKLLAIPDVTVRSVVRSESKIEAVKHDFPGASNLDFAVVPDITAEGAFDDALGETPIPFDAVIHTASPFHYRSVSDNREFLDPAVQGTTGILKSIKLRAPAVKRVVITSSFAAIGDLTHPEAMKGKHYTDDDWNPITWDDALNSSPHAAYQGSKKFAEEAAWNFLRDEKPSFDVVTFCPPMIYGPLEHTVASTSALNQSTSRIYNSFFQSQKDDPLPDNGLYLYADARDVADAHVAALFTTEAGNNRFLLCAGQISSQQISDILREEVSQLAERVPEGSPHTNGLPKDPYSATGSKAEKLLKIKYRPAKQTFRDLGTQLVELEKKD